MPLALYALTVGAFGIGVTEFIIMGLLLDVSRELNVTIAAAGLLISGYALGVTIGAPLLTTLTANWPRKQVLVSLMVIFIVGNAACALAPNYGWLMAARVLTALTHGTFFGVGAVVATGLVAEDKRASAIAIMFNGLTMATVLGVPFGTWLGQHFGWRATFWAVSLVGVIALIVLALLLPQENDKQEATDWRADLRAIARFSVLLGLLTTVLGYAGVFAVFTYIVPLLTEISGFDESATSPILLVFGGGLVAGNLLGGRLADRNLGHAIIGTLVALAITLATMALALDSRTLVIVFVGLMGATAFATVAPLQMWVLSKADGADQSLASSFNIGAFNLGNALGAWAGGMVIDHGPGIAFVPLAAAVFPLLAIATVFFSVRAANSEDRGPQPNQTAQMIGSNCNAN